METIHVLLSILPGFCVIELPIRDGNNRTPSTARNKSRVIELPIRDGNFQKVVCNEWLINGY